jgi:RimJ/RimL family protein N-acetyltransferase
VSEALSFAVWPQGRSAAGRVTLVPIRHEDLGSIMIWRNAQMDVLRQQASLTPQGQENYWRTVLQPAFADLSPSHVLVSVLADGDCVAYGGLVHIDWESRRAEVSFLAPPDIARDVLRYASLFRDFLAALKTLAFNHLGLHRLFTETYDLRPHHVQALEASGFDFEGRMIDHVRVGGRYVDSLLHGCVRESP